MKNKAHQLLGVAALMLTLTAPSFAGVIVGGKSSSGVIVGGKADSGIVVGGGVVANEGSLFEELWAMVAGILIST